MKRKSEKMADVRDILELENATAPEVSKEVILGLRKDSLKKKKEKEVMRRPEGMHRELYALLYSDSNKDLPPLLPTDNGMLFLPTFVLQYIIFVHFLFLFIAFT